MANESIKIIVKVNEKSSIKLSHSKAIRAITSEELDFIIDKCSDCHILVIEGIYSGEEEHVKSIIEKFKLNNSANEVLFFIPDNDDITSGLADELDYTIFLSLNELYKKIMELTNVNVSTYLSDKKLYNTSVQDLDSNDITSIFGSIYDESDYEEPFSYEQTTVNSEITPEVKINESNYKEYDTDCEINVNGYIDVDVNFEEVATSLSENPSTKVEESEEIELYIAQLKREINDSKYEYSLILNDMKNANEQIEKLTELVTVLKEQKDDILNRFNNIVKDELVIEEPISLSVYESVKEELESSIKTIGILNKTIEENNKTISNYEETINSIKNELDSLNESIESGRIHSEIIAEYEEKIKELNSEKEDICSKNKKLLEDNSGFSDKIEAITKDLAEEVKHNEELCRLLDSKEKEIEEINKGFQDKINTDLAEANKTIINLKQLVSQIQSNERKLKEEVTEKDSKIVKLVSELDTMNESIKRLRSEREETNDLAKLTEENKTNLEEISRLQIENSVLNDKILKATKDKDTEIKALEASFKETEQKLLKAMQTIDRLKKQKTKHNDNIQLNKSLSIDKLKYNGKAQIISVFGSGGSGTTTLAMSIAYKLYNTSKVLYMDMDLVTPDADAWFKKPPTVNIPKLKVNGIKASSLGVFYEHGVEAISAFFDKVTIEVEKSKVGYIHYFSGCYYRPDIMKVISANYSCLFEALGSHYDYIVIDLGRLGNSELNDSIIKETVDISTSAAVTTCSDYFAIRNFNMKLVSSNIDMNKISWLINSSISSVIEQQTKKVIGNTKYGIMPIDNNLRGTRDIFEKYPVAKDMFEMFLNTKIFGGV